MRLRNKKQIKHLNLSHSPYFVYYVIINERHSLFTYIACAMAI